MLPARPLAILAALGLAITPLQAQQPNGNAAAFGMADSYLAAARNYDAVAWNPANLALPGSSVAAFIVGGVGLNTGLGPVDLRMIGQYNGTTIPAETKESWLQLIGEGRERGRTDAGATFLAMSVRNVAFQVASSGYGNASLNRDAAEVLLYGNAGRTGSTGNFNFAGSSADGGVFTTAAASVGVPLPLILTRSPDETITLGLTAKYVIGNAVARAEDAGSSVTANTLDVAFPMIYGKGANLGHGIGMDVGLAWHSGRTTLGLAVQNVVNTFAWDTTTLTARLGTASFNGSTASSSFGDTAYSLAPAAMRAAVEAQHFSPAIGGGVAVRASDALLLTADAHLHTGDGIEIGPRAHVGGGIEFSGIPFLPIRLGAAAITGGWQGAAGLGLRMGDNHLGVSAMVRDRDGGRSTGAMLNLIAFY